MKEAIEFHKKILPLFLIFCLAVYILTGCKANNNTHSIATYAHYIGCMSAIGNKSKCYNLTNDFVVEMKYSTEGLNYLKEEIEQ